MEKIASMYKAKKVDPEPSRDNVTRDMDVPAEDGKPYSIRPEGKTEYPKGKQPNFPKTRMVKPHLTPNQDNH